MIRNHKNHAKNPGRKDSSAISRLLSIGKLGLDVAKSEAGFHLKKAFERNTQLQKLSTQIAQIQMITKTLGEMKGAVMKIGQMLSLYDIPGLPPEVRDILSQLQKHAPALPFDEMRDVIETDIPDFFNHVQLEGEKPIAAASIGQVYKGTYKGNPVAVKVQIPDVEKMIKSDLKNLNVLTKLFSPWISQKEMKAILKEIKDHLLTECDYQQELKNQQVFKKLYGHHPHITFPSSYEELSSKHVLTMEFLEGDDIQAFLQTHPSKQRRNEIVQIFFDFYVDQIFNHCVLHADPQFGNYLFQDHKMGVVDFGCVKYFDKKFIQNLIVFLNACYHHDPEAIHEGYLAIGLATARNNSKWYDTLDEFLHIAEMTYKKDQYQYGEYQIIHKIFQALPKLLMQRNLHYPPDLLMIERTMAGLYFLAEKFQANASLKDLMAKYVLDSETSKQGYCNTHSPGTNNR